MSDEINQKTSWWKRQNTGTKVGIGIAGICCLGLLLILGMSAMASPDATTSTISNDSSQNTAESTVSQPTNTATSSSTSDTSSSSSSSASGIQVKVTYSGSWSGNYGDESGSQSVDGSGSKTFQISGDPSVISAVFQKDDGGSRTLTVEIIEDGTVVESKSTSAAYGVVSAGHSFF